VTPSVRGAVSIDGRDQAQTGVFCSALMLARISARCHLLVSRREKQEGRLPGTAFTRRPSNASRSKPQAPLTASHRRLRVPHLGTA
jgi:hypothetical protein